MHLIQFGQRFCPKIHVGSSEIDWAGTWEGTLKENVTRRQGYPTLSGTKWDKCQRLMTDTFQHLDSDRDTSCRVWCHQRCLDDATKLTFTKYTRRVNADSVTRQFPLRINLLHTRQRHRHRHIVIVILSLSYCHCHIVIFWSTHRHRHCHRSCHRHCHIVIVILPLSLSPSLSSWLSSSLSYCHCHIAIVIVTVIVIVAVIVIVILSLSYCHCHCHSHCHRICHHHRHILVTSLVLYHVKKQKK